MEKNKIQVDPPKAKRLGTEAPQYCTTEEGKVTILLLSFEPCH